MDDIKIVKVMNILKLITPMYIHVFHEKSVLLNQKHFSPFFGQRSKWGQFEKMILGKAEQSNEAQKEICSG